MAQFKVFNVNIVIANDNGGVLTLDQLLLNKLIYSLARPQAKAIAEGMRDELNALARPDGAGGFDPYPVSDIIITVDQLNDA